MLLHELPNPPFSPSEETLFLAEVGEINQWEQFRKWARHLLWSPGPMLLIDTQQPIVQETRPESNQNKLNHEAVDFKKKGKIWQALLNVELG